jgi:hypothetical protein
MIIKLARLSRVQNFFFSQYSRSPGCSWNIEGDNRRASCLCYSWLFLEERVESPAGIIGIFGIGGSLGNFGGPGLSFDAELGFKKLALVADVLPDNPFRDRLGTFIPQSRIKEPALFAGIEVGTTFETLAARTDGDRHGRATHGTAGCFPKGGHRPGTELPGALRFGGRGGFFFRRVVLITPLTIFSVHKRHLDHRDK